MEQVDWKIKSKKQWKTFVIKTKFINILSFLLNNEFNENIYVRKLLKIKDSNQLADFIESSNSILYRSDYAFYETLKFLLENYDENSNLFDKLILSRLELNFDWEIEYKIIIEPFFYEEIVKIHKNLKISKLKLLISNIL